MAPAAVEVVVGAGAAVPEDAATMPEDAAGRVTLRPNGSDPGGIPSMPSVPAVFQELERGPRERVAAGYSRYAEVFRGREPIADLGCGRGEFLEVMQSTGLRAYGIDACQDAVAACRDLGFDARHEDLLGHLDRLPAESLGGVFIAHVVEHLPAHALGPLLVEVGRVLRPGGAVLVETPNPASFAVHVQSFWRDPTHVRPVPSDALAFAARTAGLVVEGVWYFAYPPDGDRLAKLDPAEADGRLAEVVRAVNERIDQLNELLYGPQEYALLAVKPE